MIQLYLGPMWAGKTTLLIQRVMGLRSRGETVLALKPAIDSRYDACKIVSHGGAGLPATRVRDAEHLQYILDMFSGVCTTIAIDEIQFMPPETVSILRPLFSSLNILGSGLDLDCFGAPFPVTRDLTEYADSIIPLTSKCGCGGVATLTQRIAEDGSPITSGDVVEVGGSDRYAPVCPSCWVGSAGSSDAAAKVEP